MTFGAVTFGEENHARDKPILWNPKNGGIDCSSVVLVASDQIYHSLRHGDNWKVGDNDGFADDRCLRVGKDGTAAALTERAFQLKVHPLHYWSIPAGHFDQYRCVAHSQC